MTNAVGALSFVGFVVIGLVLLVFRRQQADEAGRQRLASVFIGYVVVISFGAGMLQRNFWPFSSWSLMVGSGPRSLIGEEDWHPARSVGVTSDGREHRIDYRSWQPFSYAELIDTWIHSRMPDLPADARDRVGVWLLSQANAGREAAIDRRTPGTWSRILGPLTAPTHFFHKARWSSPGEAPAEPFQAVRYYLDYFDVEARVRDPDRLWLVLLYEYPP